VTIARGWGGDPGGEVWENPVTGERGTRVGRHRAGRVTQLVECSNRGDPHAIATQLVPSRLLYREWLTLMGGVARSWLPRAEHKVARRRPVGPAPKVPEGYADDEQADSEDDLARTWSRVIGQGALRAQSGRRVADRVAKSSRSLLVDCHRRPWVLFIGLVKRSVRSAAQGWGSHRRLL
jgi:hypothetical protein